MTVETITEIRERSIAALRVPISADYAELVVRVRQLCRSMDALLIEWNDANGMKRLRAENALLYAEIAAVRVDSSHFVVPPAVRLTDGCCEEAET